MKKTKWKKVDLLEEIQILKRTIRELVLNPYSESSMIIKTTVKIEAGLEKSTWFGNATSEAVPGNVVTHFNGLGLIKGIVGLAASKDPTLESCREEERILAFSMFRPIPDQDLYYVEYHEDEFTEAQAMAGSERNMKQAHGDKLLSFSLMDKGRCEKINHHNFLKYSIVFK